jgi:hypothetical protein
MQTLMTAPSAPFFCCNACILDPGGMRGVWPMLRHLRRPRRAPSAEAIVWGKESGAVVDTMRMLGAQRDTASIPTIIASIPTAIASVPSLALYETATLAIELKYASCSRAATDETGR